MCSGQLNQFQLFAAQQCSDLRGAERCQSIAQNGLGAMASATDNRCVSFGVARYIWLPAKSVWFTPTLNGVGHRLPKTPEDRLGEFEKTGKEQTRRRQGVGRRSFTPSVHSLIHYLHSELIKKCYPLLFYFVSHKPLYTRSVTRLSVPRAKQPKASTRNFPRELHKCLSNQVCNKSEC